MEEVPRKQLAGMKILVVEDEKGMTQVLRRGLEEDDHAVSLAHDSPSALSLAQDTQFDLVLARRDAAWNQRDSGRAPISRTPARHCGSIEGRVRSATAPSFVLLCPWLRIASPFLPSHM